MKDKFKILKMKMHLHANGIEITVKHDDNFVDSLESALGKEETQKAIDKINAILVEAQKEVAEIMKSLEAQL